MRARRFEHGGTAYVRIDCPGCQDSHVLPVTGPRAWGWNGRLDLPTFTPSILVRARACDPSDPEAKALESTCHSFVTDGRIQYLTDTTHGLSGQTVDLPDLPEDS